MMHGGWINDRDMRMTPQTQNFNCGRKYLSVTFGPNTSDFFDLGMPSLGVRSPCDDERKAQMWILPKGFLQDG